MSCCFEVLGLSSTASWEQVRAAWQRAAMRYHPDRAGASQESIEMFKRFRRAYEQAARICATRPPCSLVTVPKEAHNGISSSDLKKAQFAYRQKAIAIYREVALFADPDPLITVHV